MNRTAELHAATGANPGPATVEQTEQLGRLDEALARLGERERLAIHLYYLEADPVAAAALRRTVRSTPASR